MTEVRGPLTTLNNSLPTGIDAAQILNWRLAQDGYSYAQLRADVGAGLDGWNRDFLDAWGELIFLTDMNELEYPNGGAISDFTNVSELDRYELWKGDTSGHTLPMDWKGKGIGGSRRFFDEARRSIIESSIRGIVIAGKNTIEKAILTRLFSRAEIQISNNAYDVGMASASQTVPFTPMQVEATVFTSAHDHHLFYNDTTGGVDYDDMLNGIALDVLEHGQGGTGIYLVSENDVATIQAFTTQYAKPVRASIQINGGSTSTPIFTTDVPMQTQPKTGGRFFGYWSTAKGEFELRASARIPTGYAAFWVSQGSNARYNPIYVRYHPKYGFGYFITEIPSNDSTFPVKEIQIENIYGCGAGEDRVIASVGYIAAGAAAWVNPTIA